MYKTFFHPEPVSRWNYLKNNFTSREIHDLKII